MEVLTIEINKCVWDLLLEVYFERAKDYPKINKDYTLKKVDVKDDFFNNDQTHQSLKKASNDAYKRLKEYEFKQRNK